MQSWKMYEVNAGTALDFLYVCVCVWEGVSFWDQPWLIVRSFTVLKILSSQLGMQDFRLTLDLNRVLTNVDLPKPLWPADTHNQRVSILAAEQTLMSLDREE